MTKSITGICLVLLVLWLMMEALEARPELHHHKEMIQYRSGGAIQDTVITCGDSAFVWPPDRHFPISGWHRERLKPISED